MQVLGFHFVKNAKNKEILHVTGSNPVQYVRTATSMIVCLYMTLAWVRGSLAWIKILESWHARAVSWMKFL